MTAPHDNDAPSLTAIKGGGSGVRPWRRRSLEESEQITCSVCEADTGTATSVALEVRLAPRRSPGGRVTGGTRVLACAHCLARGKVTELSRL